MYALFDQFYQMLLFFWPAVCCKFACDFANPELFRDKHHIFCVRAFLFTIDFLLRKMWLISAGNSCTCATTRIRFLFSNPTKETVQDGVQSIWSCISSDQSLYCLNWNEFLFRPVLSLKLRRTHKKFAWVMEEHVLLEKKSRLITKRGSQYPRKGPQTWYTSAAGFPLFIESSCKYMVRKTDLSTYHIWSQQILVVTQSGRKIR